MSAKPPELVVPTQRHGRPRTRQQRHLATTARLRALRNQSHDEEQLLTHVGGVLADAFAAREVIIARHTGPVTVPLGEARLDLGAAARLTLHVATADGERLVISVEQPFDDRDDRTGDPQGEDVREDLAFLEELGRVMTDVLDAERSTVRLRQREAELTSILGAIPDILTITDSTGHIVGFHNGDDRHALDPSDFIGRHLAELLPPDVWRTAQPVWQRAIATRRVQEHRCAYERDGRTLHFVSRGLAYGDPPRVLWHTRDVTDELRMQEKLLSIQRFEGIALLASALAHDFSNLLTGVLGNAEFARAEAGPNSPIADPLADVISAARRASDLCQQLLGMSGKRRYTLGFVNLSTLCEEMLVILRTSIGRRVTVVRELTPPDTMPALIGDAIQLRQVVLNLLSSASDAVGDQGGVIAVRSGVARGGEDDAWAYLEVEDSGRGLDEVARRRLLEPFLAVPLEPRELGLAATFAIVRAHGGTVEVEPGATGGTRVRVLLPIESDERERAVVLPRDEAVPTLWRGGLVLVVTTDPTTVTLCRRSLEHAGHRVQHIGSGDEALSALRSTAALLRGIIIDADALGPGAATLTKSILELAPSIPRLVLGGEQPDPASRTPIAHDALGRALARLIAQL